MKYLSFDSDVSFITNFSVIRLLTIGVVMFFSSNFFAQASVESLTFSNHFKSQDVKAFMQSYMDNNDVSAEEFKYQVGEVYQWIRRNHHITFVHPSFIDKLDEADKVKIRRSEDHIITDNPFLYISN